MRRSLRRLSKRAEAASSVGILITTDLARLVLEHLRNDPSGVHKFRLVCKQARDVVDGERVTVLRVRGAAEAAGTDAATQLRLACGLLARGTCRRLRELALTPAEAEEEEARGAAERLFRSVPRNPSPTALTITKLTVSLRLLTPEAARVAEAALPGLEELVVRCEGIDGRVDASINWLAFTPVAAFMVAKALEQQRAIVSLAVLLGPSSGAPIPLLPALRRLELGPNLDELPLALAAALRGATQLRSLRLHLDLSHGGTPASLSRLWGMTQLDTLELASRNAHRPPGQSFTIQQVASFGAALAPLGGSLRCLDISFEPCDIINPSCFTALRSLQQLRLGGAAVSASSLSGLTSLTRLHAGCVKLTAAEELPAGARFRLPPQLQALRLWRSHSVEALAALEPLPSLTEVAVGAGHFSGDSGKGAVQLWLEAPTSADADGRLSRAGEEALCRTAELLSDAHTLVFEGAWRDSGIPGPLLLPPVGSPAPGFDGHGRWLSAWGANKLLRKVALFDVALSAADLATIAQCMPGLQRLALARCSFPVEAMCMLADLPRLTQLGIVWPPGTAVPQGADAAFKDLRARTGPRLTVTFRRSGGGGG